MVGENLFVDGTLARKFLPPSIPDELAAEVDEGVIKAGDTIGDAGSTFAGYAANVTSQDDVRQIVDSLMRRPEVATATHVIYAYRYTTPAGPIANFQSDGDHGVGLRLLKEMQSKNIIDKMLIACRSCSHDYQHIGNRRFDHAIEVCFNALAK
jgi:hypothetical protein